MADTDEAPFEVLMGLLRQMSPEDKLHRVLQMSAAHVAGYQDIVRRRYPQASEREVFLRAAAMRLGKETVKRVYGWDCESSVAP